LLHIFFREDERNKRRFKLSSAHLALAPRPRQKTACAGLFLRSLVGARRRAAAGQRSEAVRRLNVTVETNTTAVPANRCVDMPRCGSFFANVIITDDDGFCI
jgi:hypothetical protein